jgi:hypothetical protein
VLEFSEQRAGAEMNFRKIFAALISAFVMLFYCSQGYAKTEATIWFVEQISVGLERWIDTDGSYKYYNYRPYWVESQKMYSNKIFASKQECKVELLSNYSNVWRSGSSKTIVDRRDENWFGVEEDGFFTTNNTDWDNDLVQSKTFYTCGSKTLYVEDFLKLFSN